MPSSDNALWAPSRRPLGSKEGRIPYSRGAKIPSLGASSSTHTPQGRRTSLQETKVQGKPLAFTRKCCLSVQWEKVCVARASWWRMCPQGLRWQANRARRLGTRVRAAQGARRETRMPLMSASEGCCCSVAQSCLFVTPWTAGLQAPLPSNISQSLLKVMSTELVMLSISSSDTPFSSCPPSLPASGSFPRGGSSHQVARVLEPLLQR